MSRSGYTNDDNEGYHALWRGQVASAIRGKRGQAFLKELIEALDALPEKKLIPDSLKECDGVCALGSVGQKRGMDMRFIDPDDSESIAAKFGIAWQMACEIMYMNDEAGGRYVNGEWRSDTPEERWVRVRKWAEANIRKELV